MGTEDSLYRLEIDVPRRVDGLQATEFDLAVWLKLRVLGLLGELDVPVLPRIVVQPPKEEPE